jgi:hypothetical protein
VSRIPLGSFSLAAAFHVIFQRRHWPHSQACTTKKDILLRFLHFLNILPKIITKSPSPTSDSSSRTSKTTTPAIPSRKGSQLFAWAFRCHPHLATPRVRQPAAVGQTQVRSNPVSPDFNFGRTNQPHSLSSCPSPPSSYDHPFNNFHFQTIHSSF